MHTVHIIADVPADRRVMIELPPETPLGKAELTVTVAPQEHALPSKKPGARSVRDFMGAVSLGDSHSADNDRIDADLAREYAGGLGE